MYSPSRMVAPQRVLAALIPLMTCASLASAQSNPLYVGGALAGYFQQRSDQVISPSGEGSLGGNGFGESVLFGRWVSQWMGIELETSFAPTFSNQFQGGVATRLPSRRDTFWSGQVRLRTRGVEQVFGVAYRHSVLRTHITFQNGETPLDDEASDDGVAVVLGVDAPLKVASHVDILPTFRMVLAGGRGIMLVAANGSGGTDTFTGLVTLRYGAGVRVRF